MRTRSLAAALVALALVGSACGRLASNGPGSGGSPTPSTDPNQLVLRVDTCCGFVRYEYTLRQLPPFSLFADGRFMTLGPQIEIYPGPSLPNVQQAEVTDDAIRRILDAARAAGLYEDRNLTQPTNVSDAPTTIFTLVEPDGTRHVTRVYGLMETDEQSLPKDQREARDRLRHLYDQLTGLRDWLPHGSVTEDHSFSADALRVFVRDYASQNPDPSLQEPSQDWPLSRPLADFGQPVDGQAGLRCGVVQGADFQTLLPKVNHSNELTPWVSGSSRYLLVFRPLLPDETGC
jgi:hypothetical protein